MTLSMLVNAPRFGFTTNSPQSNSQTSPKAEKTTPPNQADVFAPTKPVPSFWQMPSIEMTSRDSLGDLDFSAPLDMIHHTARHQVLHADEAGHLKLILNGMAEASTYGVFATHDGLTLLEKPVDVVVTSETKKAGLATLINPRGRSFMTPNATITLSSSENSNLSGIRRSNTAIQTSRWLEREGNEVLASQIINKAGVSNRKKLVDELQARDGQKNWSAMQALHLGKKGLIDGILVGHNDQVITRADLNSFLENKKTKEHWSEKEMTTFLQDSHRIEEVPSRPLAEAFPESVSSIKKAADAAPQSPKETQLFLRKPVTKTFDNGQEIEPKPYTPPKQFIVGESAKFASPSYLIKQTNQPAWKSILGKGSVFYAHMVDQDSINRTLQGLKRLDTQAVKEGSQEHLSLYINTLGGSVIAGKQFVDALKRLKTPVDIVVSGVAASAGSSYLLSAATGKRFAMPNTSIMIHEPNVAGQANEVGEMMKQLFESMQRDLANRTGRKLTELKKDTAKDFWMNPLEALFYGDKGLIDGIIVGPHHVITRKEITPYLVKKLGSLEAVEKALQERFEQRRDVTEELSHKFHASNPFSNFYQTIQDVAKKSARILGQDPEFKHSGPAKNSKMIEHIPIKAYIPIPPIQLKLT